MHGKGGMHGRVGACMAGGCTWQGASMVGGMQSRGRVAEGMCGRGGMHGRGVCMVGGMRGFAREDANQMPILLFFVVFFAGSLESANSSILTARRLFKDFGGEKIRILC